MKLKCYDGKVRVFKTAHYDGEYGIIGNWNSCCMHCGKDFGFHDTKILKTQWKKHICLEKSRTKRQKKC